MFITAVLVVTKMSLLVGKKGLYYSLAEMWYNYMLILSKPQWNGLCSGKLYQNVRLSEKLDYLNRPITKEKL